MQNTSVLKSDPLEKFINLYEPHQTAQGEMAPVHRSHYYEVPPTPKLASVLSLLYPKNDEWHMVFIRRVAAHPKDKHAGQISFPGGKYEEIDDSNLATAIRETEEEIGVHPDKIHVIGALSELYIPVSNFLVHPFIGYSLSTLEFIPDPSEVDGIIEVPIKHLVRKDIKKKTSMNIRGNILKDIPYFDLHGEILWGATAMITSEIVHNLDKIEKW